MSLIAEVKDAISSRTYHIEHGGEYKGKITNCPSNDHKDVHPSAWEYTGRDGHPRIHCGVCGFDADVIGLAMELHGFNFKTALKHLADRAGIKAHDKITPAERVVAERARKERTAKQAAVAAFREWEQGEANEIAKILRRYRKMRVTRTTYTEDELQDLAWLQGNIDVLAYHYEILCGCNDREKYVLFSHGV